jgi:hypothetical protein
MISLTTTDKLGEARAESESLIFCMIFVVLFSSIYFLNIFSMILKNTLNCSELLFGILVEIPAGIPLDFLRHSSTSKEKSVYDCFASEFSLLTSM